MYVYCAGPLYGSGTTGENIRRIIRMADTVALVGHVPFVPHLFYFWDLISPHQREFWMHLDLQWLGQCDVMLRLSGGSPGSDTESDYAKLADIPMATLDYEDAITPRAMVEALSVLHELRKPG